MIQVPNALVSTEWLYDYLEAEHLIVLNATIGKVTGTQEESVPIQIPTARFFDIKHKFSVQGAKFPNTFPSEEQFVEQARLLGINKNSAIVVYDEKGIYSSARAWWMFKVFGHNNVAVLDGGLPEWIKKGYKTEKKQELEYPIGDFVANYQKGMMMFFDDMEKVVKDKTHNIVDARSESRFYGQLQEPREGLRSGHIPNSSCLPFVSLQQNGVFKEKEEIKKLFFKLLNKEKQTVFSCGSGITACVLALGAEIVGIENISVYDGSWTEWGTLTNP